MRPGYGFSALMVAVMLVVAVGSATAQRNAEPIGGYAGHLYLDQASGRSWSEGTTAPTVLGGDVYTNTSSPAIFGVSSTDLASIFGDRVTTTGLGLLDENDFTIFNSPSSAGNLLTVSFNIALYNAASNALLASYSTGVVDYGTGLPPGFYSIVTVTGLSSLAAVLTTTDILMLQQVASHTGPASRLGIASLDPPTIGSSTNQMYINSSTIGPPGYYTLGNPPLNANPGYRINVNAAVPTKPTSWGALKALFR